MMHNEIIQKGIDDPDKRRLAFFVGKLAGGGAERMVSRLSAALSDEYNVYIILYSPKLIDYHSAGTIINAGGSSCHLKLRLLHAAFSINRIVKEYRIELVISFLEAPNVINGLVNSSCRKVLSIRTWQEKTMFKTITGKLRYMLLKKAVRKSDSLITLTERQKKTVIREMGLSEEQVTVLENFYDTELIRKKAQNSVADTAICSFLGPRTAVTVGRLVKKKNMARLLRVFSLVLERCPEAKLLITGDGPLKSELEALCTDLRINDSVMFAGRIIDPYPVIAKAVLYISLSENEGFPNALVEAMACSVPILHTDCPTGPREILDPDREDQQTADEVVWAPYGVLLPVEGKGDEELLRRKSIAKAWVRMLQEDELRSAYARAGRERASEYDVSKGREAYLRLIDEVLESPSC